MSKFTLTVSIIWVIWKIICFPRGVKWFKRYSFRGIFYFRFVFNCILALHKVTEGGVSVCAIAWHFDAVCRYMLWIIWFVRSRIYHRRLNHFKRSCTTEMTVFAVWILWTRAVTVFDCFILYTPKLRIILTLSVCLGGTTKRKIAVVYGIFTSVWPGSTFSTLVLFNARPQRDQDWNEPNQKENKLGHNMD